MDVLIVKFGLDGLSEAEYHQACEAEAPAFAELDGLLAKIWLADATSNTYGGVYTFRDRPALEDYLASDTFREIGATPGIVGLTAETFEVLEGPTRITSGQAMQSV